jgi:hypothetical protein
MIDMEIKTLKDSIIIFMNNSYYIWCFNNNKEKEPHFHVSIRKENSWLIDNISISLIKPRYCKCCRITDKLDNNIIIDFNKILDIIVPKNDIYMSTVYKYMTWLWNIENTKPNYLKLIEESIDV